MDESKSESGKNTTSTTKGEGDGFNIQRISILINKNQTLINVEKLDKDEFNLIWKKRNKCWFLFFAKFDLDKNGKNNIVKWKLFNCIFLI